MSQVRNLRETKPMDLIPLSGDPAERILLYIYYPGQERAESAKIHPALGDRVDILPDGSIIVTEHNEDRRLCRIRKFAPTYLHWEQMLAVAKPVAPRAPEGPGGARAVAH
jgi:hypothetical protein